MKAPHVRLLLVAVCCLAFAKQVQANEETTENPINALGSGLQSLFGTITQTLGALTDAHVGQLRDHVEKGEFYTASQYYLEHEKAFTESETLTELLAKIAIALNAAYARTNDIHGPGFVELQATLAAYAIPAERDKWEVLRLDLKAARKRLRAYDEIAFLQRPRYRVPEFAELSARVEAVEAGLKASAEDAFRAYDHVKDREFFDIYPLELAAAERSAIAKSAASTWLAALASAEPGDVARLLRLYAGGADETLRAEIAKAVRQVTLRANGWQSPLTLAQSLQVNEVLRSHGLPEGALEHRLEIVLLDAAGPDAERWPEKVTGLPVTRLAPGEFQNFVAQLPQRIGERAFLLVGLGQRLEYKGLWGVTSRRAERVVGQQEEPNPDWERARERVRAAEETARQTRQMDQQTQQQARQLQGANLTGFAAFGAIAAATASIYGAESAEQDLREARQKLQSTPRTVFKPIKESYERGVATHEAVKAYNMPIYLVESDGLVKRFQMSNVARLEVQTEVGVDGRDERKAQVEQSNAAELRRLDQFVSTPHGPAPEELVKHVASAQPAAVQPLATLVMQKRADEMTWRKLSSQELSRARGQSAAAELRMAEFAAADSAPTPRVAVRRLSPQSLPQDDPPSQDTYDPMTAWGNLSAGGAAGGMPAMALSGGGAPAFARAGTPQTIARAGAAQTAARSGGVDCRAEEQRITRMLNSVGGGDPSICQSAKQMLQITSQALPFYERCPINDPDGQMRAWARDTQAKARNMINETCVAEASGPAVRRNPELHRASRPAPAPSRPAPAPSSPRCPGCGQR